MRLSAAVLCRAVRVRFAPSPTGQLHLGGMRTALLNFIFARQSPQGRFLLRIEDTDRARFVPGATEALQGTLEWLGLAPDEGPKVGGPFGPYFQSQRLELYRAASERLLETGRAYRCFCTELRLQLLSREALKNRQKPGYDNRCRHLTEKEVEDKLATGTPHTIRFRLEEKSPEFQDLVFKDAELNLGQEGDFVILKSDGFPTYHLAGVVDDHHMDISHVLRGEEWLASTLKHLQLYEALDWRPPQFAHLPVLQSESGKKLSKRDGDAFVEHYRESGCLPIALLNAVTRTGGGFRDRDEKDLLELADLIQGFDLNLLRRNSARINLSWLREYNRLALNQLKLSELVERARDYIKEKLGKEVAGLPGELDPLQPMVMERVLGYGLEMGRFGSFQDLLTGDLGFVWQLNRTPQGLLELLPAQEAEQLLSDLVEWLGRVEFQKESLLNAIKEFSAKKEVDYVLMMKMLRLALSGVKKGPPVSEMLQLLGPTIARQRLDYARSLLRDSSQ